MAKRIKAALFLCSLLLTSCDIRFGYSSSHGTSISNTSPSVITSTTSDPSISTSVSTSINSSSASVSVSTSVSTSPSVSASISTSSSIVHEH